MGDSQAGVKARSASDAALALSLFFFVRGHWTIVIPPPSADTFSLRVSRSIFLSVSGSPLDNGALARIWPANVQGCAQSRRHLPGSIPEIHQPLDRAVEFPGNREHKSLECWCTKQFPESFAKVEFGTATVLRHSANRPRSHHAA